jgi:hypothetical protein
MRRYYITLCGEYFGKYVEVYARNEDSAYALAVKQFGLLNVGNVYTVRKWACKYTAPFQSVGELYNPDNEKYLRRKKIL